MPMRLLAGLLLSLATSNVWAEQSTSDLWSLYQEALQQDPELHIALATRDASAFREKEARGRLLPQINFNNNFSRNRQEYEQGTTNYDGRSHSLVFSQPLYDPSSWRGYQKFRELTLQQHLNVDDNNNQMAFELAELYFAVLAAEDEAALSQAELEATERNQQQVDALYQRQLARITDALDAQARVATLKANVLDAENTIQIRRAALAERIGRSLDEPLKRLGEQPDFSALLRHELDWVSTALVKNPALRSATHGINAAEAAVREAKASHLPRVNLNLSAQQSDIGYEGNQSPKSDTYVASIGLQIPLYSGGSTSARVSALAAERDASSYEYERLKRQVVRETRTALLQVQTAPARIRAAEQAQISAIKSSQAAKRAFELGAMDAVDVIERVRDEFRARRDLMHSHYSYITNMLLLYRWSGTLTEADILHSSQALSGNLSMQP